MQNCLALFFLRLQKKILSSSNRRWKITGLALATFNHVNYLSCSAFFIFAINASVHLIKRYGESVYPYRSPIWGAIWTRSCPFSSIMYCTDVMHSIIHMIHWQSNSIFVRRTWINSHSTLSYALLISVLIAINLYWHDLFVSIP